MELSCASRSGEAAASGGQDGNDSAAAWGSCSAFSVQLSIPHETGSFGAGGFGGGFLGTCGGGGGGLGDCGLGVPDAAAHSSSGTTSIGSAGVSEIRTSWAPDIGPGGGGGGHRGGASAPRVHNGGVLDMPVGHRLGGSNSGGGGGGGRMA